MSGYNSMTWYLALMVSILMVRQDKIYALHIWLTCQCMLLMIKLLMKYSFSLRKWTMLEKEGALSRNVFGTVTWQQLLRRYGRAKNSSRENTLTFMKQQFGRGGTKSWNRGATPGNSCERQWSSTAYMIWQLPKSEWSGGKLMEFIGLLWSLSSGCIVKE